MNNNKESNRTKIFVGVLTTVIAATVLKITSKITFNEIIKYINNILNYTVSVKTILIFLGVFLGIILVIFIFMNKDNENNDLEWLKYTKDTYKDWILEWRYNLINYRTYNIVNIHPICECGCKLTGKRKYGNTYYSNGILICPNCNKSYPMINEEAIEDFKLIIERNIKVHNYKIEKK